MLKVQAFGYLTFQQLMGIDYLSYNGKSTLKGGFEEEERRRKVPLDPAGNGFIIE